MTNIGKLHLSAKQRLGLGAAALLVLGAAGGAGAMSLTRPTVEMAPTVQTPISKLGSARSIVSVRGRVAEVYGDRFIVQDPTGRVMVDAGRGDHAGLATGSSVLVQGRYDNGQLKARFLVDRFGNVEEVGPPPPPGGARRRPGHDGAPPPPPGRDGPPAPPPGGVSPPPGAGAPLPAQDANGIASGVPQPGVTPPPPPTQPGASPAAPRR